jgi:DNA-binding NarL/FixJ family response regulator
VVAEAADGAEAVALTRRHAPDVVLMDVEMPGMDGLEATRQITADDGGSASPNDSGALGPSVLILTTFDRDDYLFAALQAGASGFLLKNSTPESLIEAVRVLARGDALLAPEITRRVIATFARPPGATTDRSPAADPETAAEPGPASAKRPAADQTAADPAGARRSAPGQTTTGQTATVQTGAGQGSAGQGAGGLRELTPREHEVLVALAGGASNAEIAVALHLGETTVKTHVSRVLTKLGARDRTQAVVLAYEWGVVRPGG